MSVHILSFFQVLHFSRSLSPFPLILPDFSQILPFMPGPEWFWNVAAPYTPPTNTPVLHCMHKSALLPLPALGAVNHSPHSHNNSSWSTEEGDCIQIPDTDNHDLFQILSQPQLKWPACGAGAVWPACSRRLGRGDNDQECRPSGQLSGLVFSKLWTKMVELQTQFHNLEKAPARAYSWMKVPTRAFPFKTLLIT